MAEYVAHIVGQINQNVNFLVEQGHISRQDGDEILSKLSSAGGGDVKKSSGILSSIGRRIIPTPPAKSNVVQARAIWAYNEDGSDSKDLSFSAGDVIEIVAETNADWWEGKIHGKQGLFPSNHVEKLSSPTTPSQPMNEKASAVQSQAVQKPVYKPFKAAYHGADVPPPAQVPQVNSVGLAQDPGQAVKKSKYGALGNTMASSAARGAGFGAGAAIGGGLVRAIF